MSAPHSLDELTRLIQSRYPGLSPQFQAGARYLIDHPTQVSTLSARKLAALAGVQPATLVRLAQHLGYAGWDALKAVFTQELHPPGAYAARALSLVHRPESEQASWQAAIHRQVLNLQALEPVNQAVMAQAVALLADAGRIVVAGFRSCYPAAFSLRYLCSLFRPDVHLLHNTGGTLSLDTHRLRPEDTVVLIGYAPYSREIIELAEALRRGDPTDPAGPEASRGCRMLALCDSQLAPMALHADCVLTFSTQGHSFFPTTVAIQALVEMLAQQLLVRQGEPALAELGRTEALLHATGAYR
ncbi:MurR/RpiR family transcriptional regulator [Castellaniella defragrans]|uniref:DNA-binding MurR/RpiR family transcriptional regulator n=1 Tax=Castellaniella defragrans TaxID=75697 RepID=A0A7W9TM61_CASDE|nr:MurR/RpiR family transcriptional regulator [Castellaniella defragrans]KAB0610382.1 MurR/RpiR family transcriptional regulator [Castellaniella defragrans]MBB6082152.1 DNA-binding MurR/RpiR family transcriptional regulator [Castellaniella defragrans]